jgi:CRP-like cAMP-binding protein
MNNFIDYIQNFKKLNLRQIDLINSKVKLKVIKKGNYYLEAGRVARQMGFLTEGILRVFLINTAGRDITRAFIPEGYFAINFASFNNKTPSEVSFVAVSDCTLLILSEKDLIELEVVIPGWIDVFTKIAAIALSHKLKLSNNMLIQDAKTRYLDFLKNYPGLANRIPLSTLASYLGVQQSSLSRIRKNIR